MTRSNKVTTANTPPFFKASLPSPIRVRIHIVSENEFAVTEQIDYSTYVTTQLQELRALPISERVQLVEDLWDSIAQDESEYTLAPEQITLLDDRPDALEKDPRGGTPWEVAKQRIVSAL